MRGTLHIPGYIFFGEDSLDELKSIKGKRAIIVTGGNSMRRNGFLKKCKELLEEGGKVVDICDGVEQNPSVETVERGAKQMQEFKPDLIIALGGGSAMDAAKVMWCFYEYPNLTFEDVVKPETMPELRNKAKFIAIPSTSGTASEITAFSVITDTKKHIKYPVVSRHIVPDYAIVDPLLPSKMPKSVTANTGMDVVAHATEALVSSAANDYTDSLAIHALKLVFENLKKAYDNGDDMQAREKMHNASTLAGMAFTSASLGIIHSMAHNIGGEFGVTHGLANAILLPYITKYNSIATEKVKFIEKELRVDNFIDALVELSRSVDIPMSFKDVEDDFDFNEDKFSEVLEDMSKHAFEDPCTLTNPRETSPEEIKELYKAAYYGNL